MAMILKWCQELKVNTVKVAFEAMIRKAVDEGFPKEKVDRIRTVVCRYDIWRINLGDDPPAKVPPLVLRLKPNAKPCKCDSRKYPPELQRFLDEFNATLVELGWVYDNPNSRWACPASQSGNLVVETTIDKQRITDQSMLK